MKLQLGLSLSGLRQSKGTSVVSPDAPTNFDVVVSGSVATCTWTAVSGVDGYNVYLKSNGAFVKQNSELITETTYDIEGLEGGNYEAYATSVKDSLESGPSNVKLFEIDDSPYIEGAFAITVKTDNTGTSNDDQFTLTSGGSLGGANYRIDWYKKADPTVTGTITDAYRGVQSGLNPHSRDRLQFQRPSCTCGH